MQATALSRFNMISARKARLVADLVRGKSVEEAVHTLSLTPKKAMSSPAVMCAVPRKARGSGPQRPGGAAGVLA